MEKTWRWFGKKDRITLAQLRQIGVEGIVTALHDPPIEVLGLPRIVRTEDDIRWFLDAVPDPHNGLTFTDAPGGIFDESSHGHNSGYTLLGRMFAMGQVQGILATVDQELGIEYKQPGFFD